MLEHHNSEICSSHATPRQGCGAGIQELQGVEEDNVGNPMQGLTPMMVAALDGKVEVVRELLMAGEDPRVKTKEGYTPMFIAAHCGHVSVVRELLARGVDGEVKTLVVRKLGGSECDQVVWPPIDSITPVYIAAECGHAEIVRELVVKQADAHRLRTDAGLSPLCIAASKGHIEVVRTLLGCGADFRVNWKGGISPLFRAAQNGHLLVLKELLEAGADPQVRTQNHLTPCYIAARNGHEKVVQELLKVESHRGGVARTWCSRLLSGPQERVNATQDRLTGQNRNSSIAMGFTPIHIAASRGHTGVVKELLGAGRSPTVKTEAGFTPLLLASRNGHVNVVRVLLNAMLDKILLDIETKAQLSPIYVAAEFGHIDVLKELLLAGEDPDVIFENGLTPLYAAARNGHTAAVKILLVLGDCLNTMVRPKPKFRFFHHVCSLGLLLRSWRVMEGTQVANEVGFTPLYAAAEKGHVEIVQELLGAGADPQARSPNGFIPISIAASNGHLEVVKAFIECTEINHTTNREGIITPLDAAVEQGRVDVVRALLVAGVDPTMEHLSEVLTEDNGTLMRIQGMLPRFQAYHSHSWQWPAASTPPKSLKFDREHWVRTKLDVQYNECSKVFEVIHRCVK
ncbi:unnamed protein product [Choristocarpus tenellus]